ncbi:MAG: LuxR C-terminal-related transcriptional regulator [Anaerolineaceae bacterium]
MATKLYIPPLRPRIVHRPRLIERLNAGLHGRLTLISAPAGFGKTTLLSEWTAGCGRPVAWLSLDEGDNDPTRFLTYVVRALQTAAADIGAGVIETLQSQQPLEVEPILAGLLNEIAGLPDEFVLVFDDYHLVEAQAIDNVLAFLVEHLPGQIHLVIATREDPHLPLARLRARGHLTEMRVGDLRFTNAEAAGFLNEVMGLKVTEEDIAALEKRTEGWIAGLQLAALSMQGHQDTGNFIKSFTASHHFVLDYLVEEVLQQQPEHLQDFLLRTSILDRMCGLLCDTVMRENISEPFATGQETLEYIEHANLFIIPLDNERKWYRYHHLFGELLRQRLASRAGKEGMAELHRRASDWFEANSLDIEAFHHATAANDVEHAERLIEGKGTPLHFRGALAPILNWLQSLPEETMNARPTLWSTYVSVRLASGQTEGIEEMVRSAEKAIETQGGAEDEKNRDLTGRLAATRALLALSRQDADAILLYSRRALDYLHPDNLPFRVSVNQTKAFGHFLRGERAEAKRIYSEALAILEHSGAIVTRIMAMTGMGSCLELDNQLQEAAGMYNQIIHLAGNIPFPIVGEAHRGLANIYFQWNDLESALRHQEKCVPMARQLINTDRSVACDVFHARLLLAKGDADGALEILTQAGEEALRKNFKFQIADISGLQIMALLRLGKVEAAGVVAGAYKFPLDRVRVCLARSEAEEALVMLEGFLQQAEARNWPDQRLRGLVLKSLALQANSEKEAAVNALAEALVLSEPGGFIRIFLDEGRPMETLLRETTGQGIQSEYIGRLLTAFDNGGPGRGEQPPALNSEELIDPLSDRELEVLRLIAEGKSNREIGEELFLALSTVKGHSQKIFDKLQVQRRTEAVARARELGVL